MKQKEMLNNTMFRMDQRMDQLQSQMDALYKAIGGLVASIKSAHWGSLQEIMAFILGELLGCKMRYWSQNQVHHQDLH